MNRISGQFIVEPDCSLFNLLLNDLRLTGANCSYDRMEQCGDYTVIVDGKAV